MTDRPLTVLDLCAGLESWAGALRARGHTVVTLDYDPAFGSTVTADVRHVTAEQLGGRGAYDAVVASPPCEGFSVGSIGRHWDLSDDGVASPKSDGARLGVEIALSVVDLIAALAPPLGFVIENPTGMMRHLLGFTDGARSGLTWSRWLHPDVNSVRAPSVTYCTLGMDYRKPTDLWVSGPLTERLELPAPCDTDRRTSVQVPDGREFRVNRRTGQPCHEVARRGARTGIQGIESYAERSIIPPDLCARVADAIGAADGPVTGGGAMPNIDPAIRGHVQESLL